MSLRDDATNIYSSCLDKLDPRTSVYNYLKLNKIFKQNYKQIYPVAFGKASVSMMNGLLDYFSEKQLTNKINKTPIAISSKTNIEANTNFILHISSHPIPDSTSIEAADKVIEYIKTSTDQDLILFLISGGGSSLLCKPSELVTLNDKVKITNLLLKSGADINEINTIRKHISCIKGGKLAQLAEPSNCISLIISDVINDDLSTIASGPTIEDATTYQDSLEILSKYNLMDSMPNNILEHLTNGVNGNINETPKKIINTNNTIICSNYLFKQELANTASNMGYEVIIPTKDLVGEANQEGKNLVNKVNKIINLNKKNKKIAIITGGETVVNIKGSGKGGRNQELALSFLANLQGEITSTDWVLLSVGTDGIDGPTDAAGAIISKEIEQNYQKTNLNINDYLSNNDSYTFLDEINALYITGPSGTNVADVQITLINNF